MNENKARFEAECASAVKELNAKKERLYNKADITQWQMDEERARQIPRSQLIDNKILAFELMLDQVSHFTYSFL